MLSSSHGSQEPDPLVNGTTEILEREGIDESTALRRGFLANLEDRTFVNVYQHRGVRPYGLVVAGLITGLLRCFAYQILRVTYF